MKRLLVTLLIVNLIIRLNFASIKAYSMVTETEKIVQAPVTLTSGAIKQLKLIYEKEGIAPENGLRIGVKGGGCSGFSYILGFDEPKEHDEVFEMDGLKIFMQKSHAIYLLGMEIDYVDGLNNRGFSFNNPNAKSTCGCGTSFSA
jgi:iron-sulfur cluster assembly protein